MEGVGLEYNIICMADGKVKDGIIRLQIPNQSLKKDTPYVWSLECQQEMDNIKYQAALVNKSIMTLQFCQKIHIIY